VAFVFVLDKKNLTLFPGELFRAGLFRIEMVKARLTGNYLAVFCEF
jgi:hypothetical protein